VRPHVAEKPYVAEKRTFQRTDPQT